MAHWQQDIGMSAMDHSSTSPPHHHPSNTSGPHSHGGGTHTSMTMPMTFYFGYKNLIDSAGAMAWAFLAVFLLAVGYEGLKRDREDLLHKTQHTPVPGPTGTCPPEKPQSACQRLFRCDLLVQTALHLLQVLLTYLLMLTVRTYNAYLGLAVVAGSGTGYWLFGGKKAQGVHCPDRNEVQLHEMGLANCPY